MFYRKSRQNGQISLFETFAALKYCYLWAGNARDFRHAAGGRDEAHHKWVSLRRDDWDLRTATHTDKLAVTRRSQCSKKQQAISTVAKNVTVVTTSLCTFWHNPQCWRQGWQETLSSSIRRYLYKEHACSLSITAKMRICDVGLISSVTMETCHRLLVSCKRGRPIGL